MIDYIFSFIAKLLEKVSVELDVPHTTYTIIAPLFESCHVF